MTSKRSTATTVARARPPSVERVLAALRASGAVDGTDRAALTSTTRSVIAAERSRLAGGADPRATEALAADVMDRLEHFTTVGVEPVINATGVIIHTNLGRAPWPPTVVDALATVASEPLLLELDRSTGRRGPRGRIAEDHLVALTDAEDALVTNNNAAALVLAVGLAGRVPRAVGDAGREGSAPSTARRRPRSPGVVVSRGELVEIGGGVRIPDIVRRAGARLIEVGTTNRTRPADYEAVLADGQADLVLRVHASNFTMTGFTETPDPVAVADVAHRYGAIVVDDLGSGALIETSSYGLAHEPMPHERLAAGADLVTFSGDKLIGGPQAGFIVGRADLIARLRRDPLARAMRPDKVTMAAVAMTLGLYRAGRATKEIPVWQMLTAPLEALRQRAEGLRTEVRRLVGEADAAGPVRVLDLQSTVGGGSLPGQTVASFGVAIDAGATGRPATRLLGALRSGEPIVIGRIQDDEVVLDLRTVEPARDHDLATAVARVLSGRA